MKLPILGKLKDGEKFDFATLADNSDQTDEFWEWWWAEKANPSVISRPEIISDDDPILSETLYKSIANLCSYREFFDKTLFNLTQSGNFPMKDGVTREAFRQMTLRVAANGSVKLSDRPQVIFAGGGYGSGKTTILNKLCDRNQLPVSRKCLVGADIFKLLIPEFHLIKGVGDGRASATVQKECVRLSDEMFVNLIESERSFVWDSSMSNFQSTLERILLAKDSNYELTMIAVLTPLSVATCRAMYRAKISRRLPHPEALPASHVGFRQNFTKYVEYFDEIKVFANVGDESDTEIVAEKNGDGNVLEMCNPELFNSLLAP